MRSLVIAALFGLSALSVGQTPSFAPPDELKKLEWLVGKWTGTGKMSMQGMEADVTMTWTTSYEGQFLKTVGVNDYGMIKIEETMYIGWNAAKKGYTAWAFSNVSPDPRIEHGTIDGNKIVMTSEPWTVMGTTAVGRGTLERKDDKTVVMTLEFKEGDTWVPASKVELKKG